jgi:protease-4
LGLVDTLGGLNDAISAAVKLAGLKDYRIKSYPEPKTLLEQLFDQYPTDFTEASIKKEIGVEQYSIYKRIQKLKTEKGDIQTRMPFEFNIH